MTRKQDNSHDETTPPCLQLLRKVAWPRHMPMTLRAVMRSTDRTCCLS